MAKYKITYIDPETRDSETPETITVTLEFEATENPRISAYMWAEDWAYGRSDKGDYTITEVKEKV